MDTTCRFVNSPSTHVELGVFPPVSQASGSQSSSFNDLIEKAQAVFQGLTILGHTVDFTAAAKVVIAAVFAPGANWMTILEAVVANLATIFPPSANPTPPATLEIHVRKMWSIAA